MSNEAPTDALRLVPVEPTEAMLQAGRDAAQSAHAHHTPWTQEARSVYRAMLAAAPASPLPGGGLPADVVRLVIAARIVAFDRVSAATIAELDAASEAFASRVPWDNAPDELPAAPTGEPK